MKLTKILATTVLLSGLGLNVAMAADAGTTQWCGYQSSGNDLETSATQCRTKGTIDVQSDKGKSTCTVNNQTIAVNLHSVAKDCTNSDDDKKICDTVMRALSMKTPNDIMRDMGTEMSPGTSKVYDNIFGCN